MPVTEKWATPTEPKTGKVIVPLRPAVVSRMLEVAIVQMDCLGGASAVF